MYNILCLYWRYISKGKGLYDIGTKNALPKIIPSSPKDSKVKKGRPKKTNEDFLREMEDFPTIHPLDTYNGVETKIRFECLRCGMVWKATPANVIHGKHGCPQCDLPHKRTHEEYVEMLHEISPTLKVIGEYTDSAKPVEVECLECGYRWRPKAQQLLEGHGCPKCKRRALRLTPEQVLNRAGEYGNDLSFEGRYIDTTTNVLTRCNKCGYVWEASPAGLVQGTGCPKCSIADRTKTHEQYLQELKDREIPLTCLERYQMANTAILHKCNICGYEWKITPGNVLRGAGCPRCGVIKSVEQRRLSPEEFSYRLDQLYHGAIVALEPCQGTKTSIKLRCNNCGREWKSAVSYILQGFGCITCSPHYSYGEEAVANYLNSHHIFYESQKRFKDLLGVGGRELSYDFWVPQYFTLIEYNGYQHYYPVDYFGGEERFARQQEHDRRKMEYAQVHDLFLLVIRYDDDLDAILDEYFNNLNSESQETVRVS